MEIVLGDSFMIERIQKNEERLNSSLLSIRKMQEALDEFEKNINNIKLVNHYYGSDMWFHDREKYDNNVSKIKSGVLSEDAVWNMLDDVNEIIEKMQELITKYQKIKDSCK